MWPFNSKKKIDPYLKPLAKTVARVKLPVLVCYKGDLKNIKNKLRYAGATVTHEFMITKTLAVSVPVGSIDKVSTLPEVKSLYYDHKATLCIHKASKALAVEISKSFNISGRDVTVGIIDSGVYPHKGLTAKQDTIRYFKDILGGGDKPYDDFGHGTYISGVIASNLDYARGIAPDARLSIVKAFDNTGRGYLSNILKGLEDLYASTPDMKVLLLPFEIKDMPDLRVNPLYDTIIYLNSKNITIICPSGNSGPTSFSISQPGIYKEVITVGGCKLQDGDFKISEYSSRGPTKEEYTKPDIVSIGDGIVSLKGDVLYLPKDKLREKEATETTCLCGTSVSAAIIAGMCALIIERYGELTPKDIRSILCLGTKSIGENKHTQGKGIVILDKIIKEKEK